MTDLRRPDTPQPAADERFAGVRRFVLFVGAGRTGSSLVGAMIDAHRRALISNELNLLPDFDRSGCDPAAAYRAIYEFATRDGAEQTWNNTGYDYSISGRARHGEHTIEVIGDKKAGRTAAYTARNPAVVERVRHAFGEKIIIINVLRNPFDTISADAHHRKLPIDRNRVDHYLNLMSGVLAWKQGLPEPQFLTLYHEDLIENREAQVRSLFGFLDLSVDDAFVASCVARIYGQPHQRRLESDWPPELVAWLTRQMRSEPLAPLLGRYDF